MRITVACMILSLIISSCGDDAEKSERVDRWIRELDSIEAIQKSADSTHNADSTAAAEEAEIYRRMDSLHDAEYR